MKKDIKWIVFIFLIACIPKCIIAWHMVPYPVYDEGGAMAFAAYIVGKDWSNVISSGAYYGFGYYMFFWPIFLVTDNPYLIYKFVCISNAVVQALCGLLCYVIISRFLGDEREYLKNSIIAILCSYLVTVRVNAYNETGLVLVTWITALFLCFLVTATDRNKKRLFSFLVFGVAIYSLTIHTRAIILVIALVIISIFYRIVYKKNLFSKSGYAFAGVFFVFIKVIIRVVQSLLWKSDGTLHNASIDLSKHLGEFNFLDPNAWKTIAFIIIGQLYSLNIFSGGLLIVAILLVFRYIVKHWGASEKSNVCLVLIYGTFMICMVGMIAGQSITWGDGVYVDLLQGLKNQYAYKAFSYVRYACAYMGPIILCGLLILSSKDKNVYSKKYMFLIAVISILIHIFWFTNIVPLITESLDAFEVFVPLAFRRPRQEINLEMYYRIAAWFLILIDIFLFFVLYGREKIYMGLILVFLCFEFMYNGYYNDVYYGSDHSKMPISSYNFLQEIIDENEEFILEDIYMYNGDYIREQFYFNNLRIIKNVPNDSIDNAVLLYTGDIRQERELQNLIDIDSYQIIEMDKNNYMLIKGEKYAYYINQSGYSMQGLSQFIEE